MTVVAINVDQIKSDLQKMGVTQEQVGIAIGRSRSWLGNILHNGTATEESLQKIEMALFKPSGAYKIEEKKNEDKPEKDASKGNGEEYVRIVKLLEELVKNTSVIRAQNEEIVGELHSWRKTNVDQHANMIERCKEQITQMMKVRSAVERSGKNESL